jgi:hypothetical protein
MRTGAELLREKRGLGLHRVVLLGRAFEEYRRYFLLKPEKLMARDVLDVAGGVQFVLRRGQRAQHKGNFMRPDHS